MEKSTIRFKELIKESGLLNKEVAQKIGVSDSYMSMLYNGKVFLTMNLAKKFIRNIAPSVRVPYLLGYDDFKTDSDVVVTLGVTKYAKESHGSIDLMWLGLSAFAQLSSFDINGLSTQDKTVEEIIDNVGSWYTLTKDSQSVKLSVEELNQLENDICDYVEFRLNKFFK